MQLRFHPVAEIFPLPQGEEFTALVESFKRVKVISPRGLMREGWFNAELVYLFSEMEKCGTMLTGELAASLGPTQVTGYSPT
jgi:hypothetical protein